MKVAHLAEFAPHRSGLYGTTRDLILAERAVGIDAVLVDAHITKDSKIICRPNLKDGDLPLRDSTWAKTADILIHHTIIHRELRDLGIPVILAIHGRPESTFCLEHRRIMAIFGAMMKHGEDPRYKAFITFWEQYMFHNSLQVPKDKLFYIPAPVDLKEYNPEGHGHKFPGNPRLLIADMWRDDVTPFCTIMAAALFHQKYCPEARINIVGAAPKKNSMQALMKMLKKDGVLGEVYPLIETMATCYRGADILLTPHNIATRIVREALACGTPIVAGSGSPYTPWTADSRDAEAYAAEINKCWLNLQTAGKTEVRQKARAVAEKQFDSLNTGLAMKKVFETVLEKEKHAWVGQDGLSRKTYSTYAEYVQHQKSKLDGGIKFDMAAYDTVYRKELGNRLRKLNLGRKNVLCLGARQGTEVKAFLDIGCFAVGIDLNPGKENKYVVTGDFHQVQYPKGSVDVVFTNSIDHVYRIRTFLREVTRVLSPGGLFVIELGDPAQADNDKWACLHWKTYEDLVQLFKQFNLHMVSKTTFSSIWFREQLCFKMGTPALKMTRTDILNQLIKKHEYESYLEIGVADPKKNFDKIVCRRKVGVDPKGDCEYPMTSDAFFSLCLCLDKTNPIYDLIFIDGDHRSAQVEKDIANALRVLREGGTLVVHDCNPPSEKWEALDHCGTVWRAWAKLRMERNDLSMAVVDTDYGCGIIRPGKQIAFEHNGEMINYGYLDGNRKALLNLVPVKEVESWL